MGSVNWHSSTRHDDNNANMTGMINNNTYTSSSSLHPPPIDLPAQPGFRPSYLSRPDSSAKHQSLSFVNGYMMVQQQPLQERQYRSSGQQQQLITTICPAPNERKCLH